MAEIVVQVKDALSDRYTIERELGRGGMATVYLARDLKHDRLVALKVLRPELAAILGADRFLREIRLTARLDHPHILPVFDSGESAGFLWYTMPYVRGESLRDRLRQEGQLPVDVAVDLTSQVASAVGYAHREGVVHRDLKPENVLLADGQARVADFGVARALEAAGQEKLTETGLAVGTPAYMSPEQASAGPVDARSDIYTLGCVLYEMLAGEPPYTGPTAQVVIAKRFSDPIPSIRRLRPEVPESVDAAIRRALARSPADRFASVSDFCRALQLDVTGTPSGQRVGFPPARAHRRSPLALLTLGLGLAIGLGVLFAWRRSHGGSPNPSGPIRVAVLPFDNLGDSSDAYFADGVTDAVRGKLAGLTRFQVTASTSSNRYRRTAETPQQIGRELGVDYLLVGRIRWAKRADGTSRVQVSPELVRIASSSTAWQEPFDAPLTDVFQVQADIASRVAGALGVALGTAEKNALAERPTRDLAAYDAFLRGERALQEWTAEPIRQAMAAYEEAVARDSTFAIAWARLAEARARGANNAMPGNLRTQAREAAERAIRLSPRGADGYRAMAAVVIDDRQALDLLRQAHDLAPNDAEVLAVLGSQEAAMGDEQPALDHLARARDLDPQSVIVADNAVRALTVLHHFEDAQREVDRALALEPRSPTLLRRKALVDLAEGDTVAVRATLSRLGSGSEAAGGVVYFWLQPWVMSHEQQSAYLRLPPDPFGGDRTWQGNAFAILYRYRGDSTRMRAYADTGLQSGAGWLSRDSSAFTPSFRHAIRGMLLAMRGRREAAHAEARAAVSALSERDSPGHAAHIKFLAAWTQVVAGDHESAITLLEQVKAAPYWVTPAYLRVDPIWVPLRSNPRFQRLVAGQEVRPGVP